MSAFLLIACVAAAADRPTAEDVAKAVEASRAAYMEASKPPTQEERIAELEAEIKSLKIAKADAVAKARTRPQKKAEAEAYDDRIDEKTRELREARTNYVPPEAKPELMPLDFQELRIGSVGNVGPYERDDGLTSGDVRCLQILEDGKMLATYEYSQRSVSVRNNMVVQAAPITVEHGPFVLSGVDTASATEDKKYAGDFDVVVTGQYSYENALGTMRTVFVLEVFDPDKPFK